MGDVREGVPTQREPITTPQHAKPPKTHRGTEEYGAYGGVHPSGHKNIWGVYEHMGHPDTPKYKNMPATKK